MDGVLPELWTEIRLEQSMKKGFVIEGKTLNVNLLLDYAKKNKLSPEEMSVKMKMGHMYLRNRRNENKKGIFREAYTGIVENAIEASGFKYDELVMDMPEGRTI